MARGFGSTFGAGSSDIISTALSAHATLRSYSLMTYRNGDGGANFGLIFSKRQTADAELFQNASGATNAYRYQRNWSTTNGSWIIARPSTGAWHQAGVSYDSGSTSNVPTMVIDGVSQSVTTELSPSGSVVNNSDPYTLGNRASDTARAWDGMLCEFAIWDAILTAEEWAALGARVSPLEIRPQSLTLYRPDVRNNLNVRAFTPGTISGTAVQPHPRMFYPPRAR